MVGSGFPYSEFLPKEGQARGVQIDIKPDMLASAIRWRSNLVGDCRRDAARLAADAGAEDRSRLAQRRSKATCEEWWKTLEGRAMAEADPVNPQRVAWELSPRLPDARSSPAIPAPAPTGTRAT